MLRGLRDRAAESFDAAFASPAAGAAGAAHVGRVVAARGTRFRLGPVFAEGGFSFVHEAHPLDGGARTVAVKRIATPDRESARRARAEADLLDALPPHESVVGYYGAAFEGVDTFLVFEMVDGGNLPDYLDRRRTNGTPPERALAIFADIVAAVVHLHAQNPPIACRDLKLENVLYCASTRRFKLCDLGSCTTVAKRYTDRREILQAEDEIKEHSSAPYRAPEMCDLYSKPFLCELVDVWSLGCVFYGILFGDLPFDGQSTVPILKGRYTVPQSHSYPPSFIKLLSAMLTVSPAKRADSFTIMEAVCRLRGTSMSNELRQVGSRLRDMRKADLGTGGQPAESKPGNPSSSAGSLDALNSQRARGTDHKPTSNARADMGMFDTPAKPISNTQPASFLGSWTSSSRNPPSKDAPPSAFLADANRSASGNGGDEEDDDWADFESAGFGEPQPPIMTQASSHPVVPRPPVSLTDLGLFDAQPLRSPERLTKPMAAGAGPSVRPVPNASITTALQKQPATANPRTADTSELEAMLADLLPPGFGKQ